MGAVALALLAVTLPVTLQRSADGSTGDDCVTVADRPTSDPARIPLLERCRVVAADDAELIADLGAAYDAAGRGADAERAYRDALAIDPDYGDVLLKLAAHLVARGAAADARPHAEHALRLMPNNPAALGLLAGLDRASGSPR